MWAAGKTKSEIREKHHREWAHINYILEKAGVEAKSSGRSIRERIIELLTSGVTKNQIKEMKITAQDYVRQIERELIASGRIMP